MPFNFKIRKRTRQYSVLSKNCFLVRVQLLDNNLMECTRPVESTGQECLDMVAQKLQLTETQYFGLWFQSKSQLQRWVELQKPLKKQLDKFATEHLLYFGVMFYVPNVSSLEQEVTRYQYYLQVKKEVLDGRLQCNFEQGIRLAGLAVQADFGDVTQFESQDFLREYALFPVGWTCADDEVLKKWTWKVAEEHKRHCGMTNAEAELLYIKEVETLDSFGQESFPAKDSYTSDVYLGSSFSGVVVKHRNRRLIVEHRWSDVGNIAHSRSAVTMEVLSRNTLTFHTDDMETAKYIARLFTAKHKFYEQNNLSAELLAIPVVVDELIMRQMSQQNSDMPYLSPHADQRRPPSYILQPVHTQYGEHLQDRRSSQDSIVQDGTYYSSETSLDRSSMEYNFHNGLARKGSVYSAPSTSSLNHLQTVAQASPVSSNLSIPGSSDVMRLDYIPRHRHSAIIAPSYRPTPDYESAVRQKRLAEAAGCHSQSLRSLNISSSFAYRQQGALVYSQPEMRERSSRLPGPWGPQMRYSMPATTAPSTHFSSSPATEPTGTIAHTVSTPELADGEQPGAGGYSAAHMLKNHLSRPPPPYPGFRPVASTPDLAGHPRGRPGSSSPELGARRVRQSVRSFQPESLVVRRSFRETGEPLTMATLSQQSSLEAMSNMVQDMEAITLRSLSASIVRRNTLREEAPPSSPRAPPSPEHARAPSDATVLIHDSESEKEDEEDLHHQTPALTQCSISAQLQAALARIPNRPPPAYPGPGRAPRSGAEEVVWTNARRSSAPKQDGSRGCAEQSQTSESAIGPSVSEPDLTCVKERVKTNVVRERPSSEMFFVHDSFVEREIMQRTMEKQKMEGDSLARPLWTAGQNSPYMTTPPIPERQHRGFISRWTTEQCQLLERKLEEEDRVAIEFVQIPWKAGDRMPAAVATLPGNAERNRLPDVVPYEENRVMLMPTKENHTGYINASHIKVLNTGEEWHYIATQGPLPNTLQDFWQMVWEQGVNVIAMVTAEEEGGRSQTHCYWPQPGSKQDPAVHGRFQVTTKFRTDSGCYANTALTVKNLLSGQERTVWHLQYTDWGRDGCPRDPQDFLCYLEEVRSVRRDTSRLLDTSRSPNPPVVVHCSTGVGLTGVLILTELLISCLEHSRSMDIPVMLARLRQQRMLMVQTFTQYKFVYHVLIHFLKNSRLI